MPDTIIIKLEEWILADGNYAHMKVGERSKFALTVGKASFSHSMVEKYDLKHVEENYYHINAKILYLQEGSAILDTGKFCFFIDGIGSHYCKPRRKIKKGDFIYLEASLEIDEFPFKEGYHQNAPMLPIIYEWEVKEISAFANWYSYHVNGPDFENKSLIQGQLSSTNIEEASGRDLFKDELVDTFFLTIKKTEMLPRFTVMTPSGYAYYLNRFKKEKADADLYQLIVQNKNSCQGAAQIAEFTNANLEALHYQIPKQEQVKQYESQIEEFFTKVVQEFNYKDCLIQDESTVKEFVPDHSHEEILYLIKRAYGVELPELGYDFTFIDFAQQLKLARNSETDTMVGQIKELPVRQHSTNSVAKSHQLKNKNIIPDPPGNVRFLAGPTGELTEKDHEEMREFIRKSKEKNGKLAPSMKIRKNQKGKL